MLARHYAPAPGCASTRTTCAMGEALLAFGTDVPAPRRPHHQPQHLRRSRRGRRQPVRRPARPRRLGRRHHRRHADPVAWSRRRHQRPPASAPREPHERHRQTRRPQPRARRPLPRHRRPRARAHRSRPAAALPARAARPLRRPRRPSCCARARPQEVSKILALANEHGLPSCPRPATPASSADRCP